MEKQSPRIERGITKLIIPHEKGELVSIYPAKGPNTYKNVGKEILDAGSRTQTGYETTLMLNPAYNSKEAEFESVKKIMQDRYFHIFQVLHWLPEQDKNSGVYSIYDSKAIGRDMGFNQEQFEEELKNSETFQGVRYNPEKGIAFAPRNTIQLGKQNDWNSFQRNGLVIATYMPKGAENLAKIGKDNFKYAHNFGVSGNSEVKTRVSALVDIRLFDGGLNVVGDNWGDGDDGHAFGVSVAD